MHEWNVTSAAPFDMGCCVTVQRPYRSEKNIRLFLLHKKRTFALNKQLCNSRAKIGSMIHARVFSLDPWLSIVIEWYWSRLHRRAMW